MLATLQTGLSLTDAVILGLVEGITEYLPVSSTGHLILTSSLLGLKERVPERALEDFEIIIQGGAILAVVGLYWPSMIKMLRGIIGKDNQGFSLFINLCIAFLPSALLGKLFEDQIHEYLFRPMWVVVALMLGGFYMIVVHAWQTGRIAPPKSALADKSIFDVTPREALFIGMLQCIALWPGTSRALMTITGGLFCGLNPRRAAEFSFLLGLPTLTAATLYKLAKNLHHAQETSTPNLFVELGAMNCLIACIVAAISAAIAVRWLVGFVSRGGLAKLGWYRIALCVTLMVLLERGYVTFGKNGTDALNTQSSHVEPLGNP
jgi:undecaprenyl-diphosphatase